MSRRQQSAVLLPLLAVVTLAGCASVQPVVFDEAQLGDAVEVLGRPSPGDLAALYRLRVAMRGGLRLAVLTAGDAGRMTVSKPLGDALSITAWSAEAPTVLFDMDEGCRLEVADLRGALGVGALPMQQAVRLLAGRLPAVADDEISTGGDAHVLVRGTEWAATVRLAAEPWRVIEVREAASGGGWSIELGEHTGSIPGEIRVTDPEGRKVLLELLRLERPTGGALPPLPQLPDCRPRP